MPRRWRIGLLLLALLAGCGRLSALAPAGERGVAAAPTSPAARPATTAPPTVAARSLPTAAPAPPTAAPMATLAAAPSPTPVGVWLTLSPASGPPGTMVTASGYVPTPPPATGPGLRYNVPFVTVCWAGCTDGIEGEATAQWSSGEPSRFTLRFAVPALPWMGRARPHPLTPGDYAVSVECLTPPTAGQFVRCPPPLTATFRLTGPPPTRCLAGPCGQLHLAPTQGPPGTLVQVTGWAPLGRLLDAAGGYLSGYALDLERDGAAVQAVTIPTTLTQAPNGDITGSLRIPADEYGRGFLPPGSYAVVLRHGQATIAQPFTVTPAPTWAALGPLRPLWVAFAGFAGQPLAVDPANPARLAACADGIRFSGDGGATWTTIPTVAARQAAATLGYRLAPVNAAPTCLAVALDPGHPTTLYAAFATAAGPGLAPPPMPLGFVTADQGRSWRLVPAPPGYSAGWFGGWRVQAGGVAALFRGPEPRSDQAPAFAVEQTTDGGRAWAPSRLACPARGPCLAWGPAMLCFGMGAPCPQWLETSGDGGATWAAPVWPDAVDLRVSGVNELAALSARDALLLTAGRAFPVRRSEDGGRTWSYVALPSLPGGDPSGDPYPGLQFLPDGALLAWSGRRATWELLPPGASAWCAAAPTTPPLPAAPIAMQTAGDRLWWLPAGAATKERTPTSAPLASLRCGSPG